MKIRSQKVSYQFLSEEDLTHKADPFVNKIRRLANLSSVLQQVVTHEFKDSAGKVIDEICNRIEKHALSSQAYYESLESSMANMANYYNQLIDEIKSQEVTLYYEEIDIR